ncbi:HNH endonuclease [Paludibaculum fermentans]|uniref:HNH endonuclease n=1 Tax=Paludibaculum fermentans TaxID=1473598 RepID=UPI003EB6AF8A
MSREEASLNWPTSWDAEYHIATVPGTAEPLREIDITGVLREISFLGSAVRLPADFGQSFRQLRRLSSASGRLFRSVWFSGETRSLLDDSRRQLEIDDEFDPLDTTDARRRALTLIVRRQGRGDFRNALMAAYERRCAITGCQVESVLEAAHIRPYRGRHTNSVQNGLLLRADLHTLFDLHLLSVDPDSCKVILAPGLRDSQYAELHGVPIRAPSYAAAQPCKQALGLHLAESGFGMDVSDK